MKTTKRKIGIIGFGNWVIEAYLPTLKKLDNSIIKSVACRSTLTMKKAELLVPKECFITNDYKLLLQNEEIDLIILSVQDEYHGEIMKEIIKSGKDCIFEMPISNNYESSKKIIERMNKNNKYFPNLELSYLPIIEYLNKLIINKEYGNLLNIDLNLDASWGPVDGKIKSVFSISPWYIDTLNKITGKIPKRVLTIGEKRPQNYSQSRAKIILDYKDHWGQWTFNLESKKELSVEVTLLFSDAEITANLFTSSIEIRSKKQKEKKINVDFKKPVIGWPGMIEFMEFVFSTKDFSNANTNTLLKISKSLEDSLYSNDWIEV